MKRILSLALSIALVMTCFISVPLGKTGGSVSAEAAGEDYMCIAYIYQGNCPDVSNISAMDFTKTTHINYAFGLIDQTTYIPYLEETVILEATRKAIDAQNPDCQLMLSIGGWGAKGFCYAAQTEERRTAFAKECKEMIDTYGFDGIDLDWEYPVNGGWGAIDSLGEADRANYTLLCQAIRNEIGPNYLLSIAGGASQVSGVEPAAMNQVLDFVNLMTYDYGSYNNADFESTKSYANSWANAGFTKSKINIGLPFYGRMGEAWPSYYTIVEYVNQGATITNAASESYATYNGSKISFDTPEMLRNKILWLKENGFGGAMTWELNHDLNNDLLNVMWSNLNGDGTYNSPYIPISGLAASQLSLGNVSASHTGTVDAGTQVTWSAIASGGSAPYTYEFDLYKDGVLMSEGSASSSSSFSYTLSESGTYYVKVTVTDGASASLSAQSSDISVKVPIVISSFMADKSYMLPAEIPITYIARATGGENGLSYSFDVYKDGIKISSSPYGSSYKFTYTPSSEGKYYAVVNVKDAAGTTASAQSSPITITAANPLKIVSVIPEINGRNVTLTIEAEGGVPSYLYSYYFLKNGERYCPEYYSLDNVVTYTLGSAGTYEVRAYVKDGTNTKVVNSQMIQVS